MHRIIYHEIGSYRRVLADPSRPRYAAWDACIKYADNDSGELSVTVAPDNPEIIAMSALASELVVEEDGLEIWRGRMLDAETDIYGRTRIIAKGVLDYLHDTVQPEAKLSGSAKDVFTAIIAAHNGKPIEDHKRFRIGTVSVSAQISEYAVKVGAVTWSVVSAIVKKYGGHIIVRRVDTWNYIDWIDAITDVCSQTVRIGSNLLDIKRSVNADSIATVIYPYGKSTDGVPLGIGSVNGGVEYIADDAVNTFGWIESTYNDGSCEDAQQLITAARAELKRRVSDACTITVSAVDLSDITAAEHIEINKKVHVIAAKQGIDELMPCKAMTRYLWDPTRTTISLGASTRAISAIIGGML